MLEKIKKVSTLKKLILFTIIFVIYYSIPVMPGFSVSDWAADAGVTLMDFQFGGYGPDEVYHVLDAVGADGRDIYVQLIQRDCIMGILYMLVLVFLIGWLLKKFLGDSRKCNWMLLFPIIAMLSDWTENLTTYCLIRSFPEINAGLVAAESAGTTLKFTFIGLSVVMALVLLIYGICTHKRRKANTK